MRWRYLAIIMIGVPVLVAGAMAIDFARFAFNPMDPPAEAGDVLHVERGMSVRGVGNRLVTDGWIDRPLYFRMLARITEADRRMQAGEYHLRAGESPHDLQRRLMAGDVIQYSFTIIEGWTFRQMMDALHSHDAIRVELAEVGNMEVMAHLGMEDQHPEGWFYPDTYRFPRGTTDTALLRKAHRRMQRILEEEWGARGEDAPVDSPYEALILGSIVERETGIADERRRVAGVFAERLDIGMRLQTDPTVIYGLGDEYTGRLRYRDLDRDTPYNTYTRAGLPPTPIAMPSRAALQAALNPDRRGEFFFVATGDGGHVFSKSLDEHNQAVIKYQLDGDASRLRGYNQ